MPFCNVFQRLPAEITRIILQFLVSDVDVHAEFEVGPLWQWEEMMEVLEARLVCADWLGHLEDLDIYNKMETFRKCRIASFITTNDMLKSFKGCTRLERYSGIKDFFVKGATFKRMKIIPFRRRLFIEGIDGWITSDKKQYLFGRMNMNNVKQLTGGEPIFVRPLFGDIPSQRCNIKGLIGPHRPSHHHPSPCRNKNHRLVLPRKAKLKARKRKQRRLQKRRTRLVLRRQRTQMSKRPKIRKYAYLR